MYQCLAIEGCTCFHTGARPTGLMIIFFLFEGLISLALKKRWGNLLLDSKPARGPNIFFINVLFCPIIALFATMSLVSA